MRYVAALATVLLFPLLCLAQDNQSNRPNIVFILADDLGRHDCGFMGGPISTPNLDKLCSAGAKLDAFYVQPVCSPTRAAYMTGRYPMRHGLQVGVVRPWAQYGLPLEERTLAQALHDAGYTTGITGKWHLGHFERKYLPTSRGFDFQYGHYNGAIDYFTHERDGGFDWHKNDQVNRDEGYSTHLVGDAAASFVTESAKKKKPFFLYVPFNAVHSPHQVPEKYSAPYTQFKGDRKSYAGMLTAMDEAIGKIIKAVDDAGVRKNTLFLFTSDNGGPAPGKVTDNGPYRAGKGTLYEGGVRVVAFATYDGKIPAGSTITQPMHAVDIFPTFTKLCGAYTEPKLPLDGIDMWPALSQGKKIDRPAMLLNTTPVNGAVRVGDWKLVVKRGEEDPDNPEQSKTGPATTELFNLIEDPYEKKNLASDQPEKVKELQKVLNDFASQAVAPKSRPKAKNYQSPKVWGE